MRPLNLINWRNFVYPIFLLLLWFVGDRFLANQLERIVLMSHFRFSRVYQGGNNYSVLILGNSRGVHAFYAPDMENETGHKVLNLSYNGMSTELAEALFMDYLDHNPAPETVILEITNLKSESELIKDLRLYYRQSPRIRSLSHRLQKKAAYASSLSHLYLFNGEMFLRTLEYIRHTDQEWINRKEITPEILDFVEKAADDPNYMKILPENRGALMRLLRTADERGKKVCLVVAPYLPSWADKIRNLPAWVDEVAQIAGPGHPVYDYSKLLQDNSYFSDRVHTNYKGSAALLTRLKEDIFAGMRGLRSERKEWDAETPEAKVQPFHAGPEVRATL
jgi:hypothetical protein